MRYPVSQEVVNNTVQWVTFHYKDKTAGIVFFDPTSINPRYSSAEVNVLLILHNAPETEKARFDERFQKVMELILGGSRSVLCRIQTVEEIRLLAEYRLPVLNIYLADCMIAYDQDGFLAALRDNLASID